MPPDTDLDRNLEHAAVRLGIAERVCVLTGAGVSAESGVPTFRASDGLWEGHRIEDVASPFGFQRDPRLVWNFYNARWSNVRTVKPNPGHFALAKMEEIRPALVLLDVMMPGMDGWQVCRTIKQHPDFSATRVVMVTAKGGFEDKHEAMRSGADDYVVKPVDLHELEEKVKRNLEAVERQA